MVHHTDLLCCLREWFASCATRSGSRIRVSCGNGHPAADSVETFRGTDLWHGQIGVGPTVHTRFVATPGGRASRGMRRRTASPRRAAALWTAPTPPFGFASLPAATHCWQRRFAWDLGIPGRSSRTQSLLPSPDLNCAGAGSDRENTSQLCLDSPLPSGPPCRARLDLVSCAKNTVRHNLLSL